MKRRLACARWPVAAAPCLDAFAARVRHAVQSAANQGANIIVLPEYLALELLGTPETGATQGLSAQFAALQAHRPAWLELFSGLARETGSLLLAGTFMVRSESGRYRNRADLFTPAGDHHWQDKLQLVALEKSTGLLEPGDALKAFEHDGLRLGIAVCYDVEFPLPVRRQREAGAQLLLVPSSTDTAAGMTRVRISCQARALENRLFIGQAVTAGAITGHPFLAANTGDALIHAPMDAGLPADGLLAQAGRGSDWAMAELDTGLLERTRAAAQVAVDRDWQGQLRPELAAVRVEAL